VRPRILADGTEDTNWKASIAIYGLNRQGLVRERMGRAGEMQRACQPIVDVMLDLAEHPTPEGPGATRLRRRSGDYKLNLIGYTKPHMPWAGMARAFVSAFESELIRRTA